MTTEPVPASPLEAFLQRYWQDNDLGAVLPLREYLRLFPGDDNAIAREYLAVLDTAPEATRLPLGPPPETIGRYEVMRELGRGGQAVVYLARDPGNGRKVAIKHLSGGTASSIGRLLREAKLLARLDHPGICQVFEAGEHAGRPYFVMRFVEGETLAACIARCRGDRRPDEDTYVFSFSGTTDGAALAAEPGARPAPTPPTLPGLDAAAALLEAAARVVHVAHEAGIVHRDIKSANIMITAGGQPVILDFGLARSDQSEMSGHTQPGDILGTPAYMAPEQIQPNGGRVDRRTDVYSLGVTLFEALTLWRPFDAPTTQGLYRAILSTEAPDVRRFNRMIPPDLALVVATALQKEPERRYQTALELADELARVRRGEPVRARPIGLLSRIARSFRREPVLAWSVTTILATLLAAGALVTTFWRGERFQREQYERLADRRRVEELVREAREDLWPAVPAKIPALESWIGRARALGRSLPELRESLAALRATAIARTEAPDLRDERLRERRDQAASLGRTIGLLEPRTAQEPDLVSDVETARATLATLHAEIERAAAALGAEPSWRFSDPKDQWRHDQLTLLVREVEGLLDPDLHGQTVASVERRLATARELEANVRGREAAWRRAAELVAGGGRYGNLRLPPQVGLAPLGVNAAGLAEFLVEQTGDPPPPGGTVTAATGIVLVLIPGGRVTIGSPEDEPGRDATESRRSVYLLPYFIGKHEITQGQWQRVMGTNPSAEVMHGPVESVSWLQCVELGRRTGLELPTEAQWEYAARGGKATAYPWGDDIGCLRGCANVFDACAQHAFGEAAGGPPAAWKDEYVFQAPVDAFAPNGFGLRGFAGNVSEWCRDWFVPDLPDRLLPGDGSVGTPSGGMRVYKDGNYLTTPAYSRCARRFALAPATSSRHLGVRMARRLDP